MLPATPFRISGQLFHIFFSVRVCVCESRNNDMSNVQNPWLTFHGILIGL